MTPLDKSLDEIIASRSNQRTRNMSRRMGGFAKSRAGAKRAARIMSTTAAAIRAIMDEGSKIIVSNLPSDVTEAQIKDLFSKSVGPTRRCFLTYGPNGQSKGIATVVFQRKTDANRAYQKYEGTFIDGTRKMKIEIVLDPNKSAAHTSFSRRLVPPLSRRRGFSKHRRLGRFKTPRPKKTLEELDAEMIDYFKNANQDTIST